MIKSILSFCFFLLTVTLQAQCDENSNTMKSNATNVYGDPLECCCTDPMTGYFRDGHCHTNEMDYGTHIVCAEMTDAFLQYSKSKGNDLITPRPEFRFPGLKAGDHWCLCISRWMEAKAAGVAPPINLRATESSALKYCSLEELEKYKLD